MILDSWLLVNRLKNLLANIWYGSENCLGFARGGVYFRKNNTGSKNETKTIFMKKINGNEMKSW